MTAHLDEARRAAVFTLWAAVDGASLSDAAQVMSICSRLWPDGELTVGNGSPLADAWRRASEALERARTLQESALGGDGR